MTSLCSWWFRAVAVLSLVVTFASQAHARHTSGSTTDADGNTTTITKNADGTTTRTLTGPDGQVISSGTTAPEPPTKVAPRQPGTSGSTTDADGNTTTVTKNPDGTTTRTVTGADGHVISSGPIEPEPPTKVAPRTPGTSASTTDASGNTTTITKNPDGTTTRTITGPDGHVVSSGPVEPEPVTKVAPRQPGTSASGTDADGNTVTITKNPDGTTTRTVTTPDGQVISSGPLTPEPPTKVPPRQPGTSASGTDADGNTVTITKNPDGTTTRTVTTPDGRIISSGPLTPEPPTKIPPRQPGTSASTTDADGNTVSITTGPNGIRVRTITSPAGNILKTEPLTPLPAGAQLLYNTVTKDECTLNTAMVLKQEGGRTLLEVSVLPTGKGTNFRTWVPQRVQLMLGKQKVAAVSATPYYVEKEAVASRLAPAIFAAIGTQYAAHAQKAESSKGTPCPLTGQVEGEHERERGKVARAIDEVGMAAGLSLLASQAKGQIEGRRVTFDVTGREDQLLAGTVVAQIANTETGGINLGNQKKDVQIKVPVNFKAAGSS